MCGAVSSKALNKSLKSPKSSKSTKQSIHSDSSLHKDHLLDLSSSGNVTVFSSSASNSDNESKKFCYEEYTLPPASLNRVNTTKCNDESDPNVQSLSVDYNEELQTKSVTDSPSECKRLEDECSLNVNSFVSEHFDNVPLTVSCSDTKQSDPPLLSTIKSPQHIDDDIFNKVSLTVIDNLSQNGNQMDISVTKRIPITSNHNNLKRSYTADHFRTQTFPYRSKSITSSLRSKSVIKSFFLCSDSSVSVVIPKLLLFFLFYKSVRQALFHTFQNHFNEFFRFFNF